MADNPLLQFLQEQSTKPWTYSLQQKTSDATKVVTDFLNSVGKRAGQQKLINFLPNSPTIAEALDKSNLQDTIPGASALKGELTPEETSGLPLTILGMFMGGAEKPETKVEAEAEIPRNLSTGSQLVRDKRFNVDTPGAFKVNTGAKETPQYASTPQTVSSGFTPEELAQQRKAQTSAPETPTQPIVKPVPERTFQPSNVPSADELLVNQKRNIQINGKDIKTPADVAQINATLNGYGISGNMTEQLQGVDSKIKELSSKAKELVTNQGGTISKNDLINSTAKNLMYSVDKTIPESQVPTEVGTYINNVYARAIGADLKKGVVVPDQIPGPVAQEMKTIMNKDVQSTFIQEDPTKWSTAQQISRHARDTMDSVLDINYPAASKLNNDMSDLYKAQDSLTKGANAESKAAQTQANLPPPENPLSALLKGSVSSFPHAAASATVLTGLGIGAYGAYADLSIPRNYKFSAGNVSLPSLYDIKDSSGKSLVVNPADYQNQINDLNKQEESYQYLKTLGIPSAESAINNLELQKQSLTNKYNATKPIYDQFVETSNVVQGLNQAQDSIKAANPSFLQAYGSLGGLLTNVRAAIDPNYSKFVQTLNNLHQLYGVDVSNIVNSGSRESADAAINETVKSYVSKLKNSVKNNGGLWPGEAPKTGGEMLKSLLEQNSSEKNTILGSPTASQSGTPNQLLGPYIPGIN